MKENALIERLRELSKAIHNGDYDSTGVEQRLLMPDVEALDWAILRLQTPAALPSEAAESMPPMQTPRFELWRLLHDEHGVLALENELNEIIQKAAKCATPAAVPAEAEAIATKIECLTGYIDYLMKEGRKLDYEEIPAVVKEANEFAESLRATPAVSNADDADRRRLDWLEKHAVELFKDQADDADGGWFCMEQAKEPCFTKPLGEYCCHSGHGVRSAIDAAMMEAAK